MKIDGEKLKCLREEKKITQVEISKECGVPRGTYVSWERNEGSPNLEDLLSIAEVLKIDFKEFVDRNIIIKAGIKKNRFFAKFADFNYDLGKTLGSLIARKPNQYNIKFTDSQSEVEWKVISKHFDNLSQNDILFLKAAKKNNLCENYFLPAVKDILNDSHTCKSIEQLQLIFKILEKAHKDIKNITNINI
jgi:transcriptional regulator with XRE-family HTH domain